MSEERELPVAALLRGREHAGRQRTTALDLPAVGTGAGQVAERMAEPPGITCRLADNPRALVRRLALGVRNPSCGGE